MKVKCETCGHVKDVYKPCQECAEIGHKWELIKTGVTTGVGLPDYVPSTPKYNQSQWYCDICGLSICLDAGDEPDPHYVTPKDAMWYF